MDMDIEVQRRGRHEPSNALSSVAEALPGLGIVAAVLGVVITMEAIGGAPETIGQKVAAALVGTFLGILLCYGVVGPLASRLESIDRGARAIPAGAADRDRARSRAARLRSWPSSMRGARFRWNCGRAFIEMETTIRRDARIPAIAKSDGGANGEAQDVAVQSA